MKTGLLIISHGSRDSSWTALVDEAIAQAEWPADVLVASSFLECVPGRDIQDGIDALEAQGAERIAVIPLFVSEGSTHVDEIGWALGAKQELLAETDLEPFRVQAELIYGSPLGEHEALYAMLAHQLQELQVNGTRDAVTLIAHGSPHQPFQTRWRESLHRMAERLTALGLCAQASHSLLCCDDIAAHTLQLAQEMQATSSSLAYQQEPERNIHNEAEADSNGTIACQNDGGLSSHALGCVAVIPLFLSRGYFTTHVIPSRLKELLRSDEEERTSRARVVYAGTPLLPHPALTSWLEQEAVRLLSRWT